LNQENVLVYGAGTVGKAFVFAVEKLSTAPLNIVGFVNDRIPILTIEDNKIRAFARANFILEFQ
jgi:FlaA1/EpsC-like NDP-sugar epimerase